MLLAAFLTITIPSIFAKAISPGTYEQVPTEFSISREALALKLKEAQRLSKKSKQVLVPPFVSENVRGLNGLSPSKLAMTELQTTLLSSGLEIVDRTMSDELEKELIMIEQSGKSLGSFLALSDYLFKGEITSLAAETSFTAATSWIDKKGKRQTTNSYCISKGSANVNIMFYSMNPLEYIDTVTSKAINVTKHPDARSCRGIDSTPDVIEAIRKTIRQKNGTIKNLFAPTGWIIDHRKKKRAHIFKTNLKMNKGITSKTKVMVFRSIEVVDPITLEKTVEKSEIGDAMILDVIADPYVWIKMKTPSKNDSILLGDYIELTSKDTCPLFDLNCYFTK